MGWKRQKSMAKLFAWLFAFAVMIPGRNTPAAEIEAFLPMAPSGHVTTGGSGFTFDVNAFLGANRYYQHAIPITGQNTVTTNLEAGHVWNGHETLGHVSTFYQHEEAFGSGVNDLFDRHATWAGMLIGGRSTGNPTLQSGISPGTDLRSAAMATQWIGDAYALSFNMSLNTFRTAYTQAFANSDVVNSSYGLTDPGGADFITIRSDGMSFRNPNTLHVVSAGNSGPSANTVGSPGSGYNVLTVGALGGGPAYDEVASFSSRGPQDFFYYDTTGETLTTVVVSGVRAAVDLSAPGTDLTSAFYGGQSGGNNTTLNGSTDLGTDPDLYSPGINGTSFSAPLVAGGAALLASAAKTLPELSDNVLATQSVVLKSLLLTGADKTFGWDNGLTQVTEGESSFLSTTQSLDWAVGAGRMNLDRTFDIQVNGQTGVHAGLGAQGDVALSGWDYGFSRLGLDNEYIIEGEILANSTFTATLAWQRIRDWNPDTDDLFEVAQADLDLSIWLLDEQGQFEMLVAQSASLYNNVEHLHFLLPETGRYGIRIHYGQNTFDNFGAWGTEGFEQDYGLAWHMVVIPEPAVWVMLGIFAMAWCLSRGGFPQIRMMGRGWRRTG